MACCQTLPGPTSAQGSSATPRPAYSLNFGGLVNSVRNAIDGNLNNAFLRAARAVGADGAIRRQQ